MLEHGLECGGLLLVVGSLLLQPCYGLRVVYVDHFIKPSILRVQLEQLLLACASSNTDSIVTARPCARTP
jgi:hypothetical protein